MAPQACKDAMDAMTHVMRPLGTANRLLLQSHLTHDAGTLDEAEAAVKQALVLLMGGISDAAGACTSG